MLKEKMVWLIAGEVGPKRKMPENTQYSGALRQKMSENMNLGLYNKCMGSQIPHED